MSRGLQKGAIFAFTVIAMAMELLCFLWGCLLVFIPGVWLSSALLPGRAWPERYSLGCALGLALAVYLASLVSHIDLNWFPAVWCAAIVVTLAAWKMRRRKSATRGDFRIEVWLGVVLILVAASRFGIALSQTLPEGSFDPTFHLILARKIQLTHHAIYDWSPFESAGLDYPTGSHVLVVILAGYTRQPLHTVFKDLIPLLGVLSTAQIFVLARRLTGSAKAALFSACAYGLWAWYGSIDYYRWGGLPNELAMLLFIAMLSVWLEGEVPITPISRVAPTPALPRSTRGGGKEESAGGAGLSASAVGVGKSASAVGAGKSEIARSAAMAILYAGVVLVHHHVMVTSGILIAVLVGWGIFRGKRDNNYPSWKVLLLSVLGAAALDGFFLVGYAGKMGALASTRVWHDSEQFISLGTWLAGLGYVLCLFAAAGILLAIVRRVKCHAVLALISAVLAILFCGCEYVRPAILAARGLRPTIAFTPSRFLTDLNYFLAIFAGLALAYIQEKRRIVPGAVVVLMALLSVAELNQWIELAAPTALPPGFMRACAWIQKNTPASTIVDNRENWTTYLAWRRADVTPMPVSEPLADTQPQGARIPLIISGKIPPDTADQKIVAITEGEPYLGQKVLWQDGSGLRVIQEWPVNLTTETSRRE